jgi:hypothetical protein
MASRQGARGQFFSRAFWGFTGAVTVAAIIAGQLGWLGWGLGHLRAQVYPTDTALLGYLPEATTALAIVNPHLADKKSLGGERSPLFSQVERIRKDLLQVTGIDLVIDVDKLVISPGLIVARGRFNAAKIAQKLAEAHYSTLDYKGARILIKAGEDALSVVDDGVLAYGSEAAIRGALEAHEAGKTLEKRESMVERLGRLGWSHPLVATVQLTDEKPSIKAAVSGNTGPRAYSLVLDARAGVDLLAVVESSSPSTAEETRKLVEEARQRGLPVIAQSTRGDSGKRLVNLVQSAKLTTDPASGDLRIVSHLNQPDIDACVDLATQSPVGDLAKGARLMQLLSP